MVKAFPELTRVAGFAEAPLCQTEHFWCVDPQGNIVDPTRRQFMGDVTYRPFNPGDVVRTGKCMNCGEEIFEAVQSLVGTRKCICSPECERDFIAWQNGEEDD